MPLAMDQCHHFRRCTRETWLKEWKSFHPQWISYAKGAFKANIKLSLSHKSQKLSTRKLANLSPWICGVGPAPIKGWGRLQYFASFTNVASHYSVLTFLKEKSDTSYHQFSTQLQIQYNQKIKKVHFENISMWNLRNSLWTRVCNDLWLRTSMKLMAICNLIFMLSSKSDSHPGIGWQNSIWNICGEEAWCQQIATFWLWCMGQGSVLVKQKTQP